MNNRVSKRSQLILQATAPVFRYFTDSPYAQKAGSPNALDFAFGNPHDMPLPAFVEALQRRLVPQNKTWFAYKFNEDASREVISAM